MPITEMGAFRQALNAVIGEAFGADPGLELPHLEWQRIEPDPAGGIAHWYPASVPDAGLASMLVLTKRDALQSLAAVVQAIRATPVLARLWLRDATGKSVAPADAEEFAVWNFCVRPFFMLYLREAGALQVDRQAFARAFRELIRRVNELGDDWLVVSPLLNARLAPRRFEIQPGVRVQRIPPHRLEAWLNASSSLLPSDRRATHHAPLRD